MVIGRWPLPSGGGAALDTTVPRASLQSASLMIDFSSRLDDPEYWRRRAAEMRKIAEEMTHLPRAQASLLETASEYDRRAARAEKLVKAK